MKKVLSFILIAFMFVFFACSSSYGQDPVKVNPKVYKFLFENDRVRVFEISFEAGEEIGVHSHPDHVVYVMTDGKLAITEVDKEPMEADLKAGQVMYLPAQTHSAINIGETQIKAVVVEIKD